MQDPNNPGGWQDVPNSGSNDAPPPQQQNYSQQPPPGYIPPSTPPPGYAPTAPGLSENAAAAISYLTFIPAVIMLVLEPYKRMKFVRFHAIQCIELSVLAFLIHRLVALLIVSLLLGHGWFLVALINGVIDLVFFVAWLVCIISAAQGKWFKLPVLGDLAMKWAGN